MTFWDQRTALKRKMKFTRFIVCLVSKVKERVNFIDFLGAIFSKDVGLMFFFF